MKKLWLNKFMMGFLIFVLGVVLGWCVGYFPIQKQYEEKDFNFIYYRDKYVKEGEIYDYIQNVACDQTISDAYKLYLIRSTYTQDNHSQDINSALKLKRSLERRKANGED